jgi:acetyl-CoA synthetase
MKKKSAQKFSNISELKPNLSEYEKAIKNFLWKDYFSEIDWFAPGVCNAAYNACDRHLSSWRRNKIALYWQSSEGQKRQFTFQDLALWSNRFANYLKGANVKKKDRVFIFLTRVPELYFAFLGILKLGAIAGTLFPAFGEEGLFQRLSGSGASVLITNRTLKPRIEKIAFRLKKLKKIIVIDDPDFQKQIIRQSTKFKIRQLEAKDPAFMLYTSATGNTPVSGIVIPHQAILQEHLTAKWVLDLKEEDIYWCTADPGWVTGVVYGILAPWSLGVSQVVFEGRFEPMAWYKIIEDYKISVVYTAPTAIRMLQSQEETSKKFDLSSVRLVATVGEALTPASFRWLRSHFKCPVLDTYWQTETGAMMICNFLCFPSKIGSMGKPVPGIEPYILDDNFKILPPFKEGNLAFRIGWPSMMVKIWENKPLYKSYFHREFFISGDRAYKDREGYFFFVGRKSEIIKTSGERVGTFEVESAISSHPAVLENAVIGKPDKIRGEIIKAFIVLKNGFKTTPKLKKDIIVFVKKYLAGHAYPRQISFVNSLPKTRSGKILRRLLKAKELGLPIGDISTLEED